MSKYNNEKRCGVHVIPLAARFVFARAYAIVSVRCHIRCMSVRHIAPHSAFGLKRTLARPGTALVQQNQIVKGGLLCGRDLFHRRSFDVGLVTLLIGLVQEIVDDACPSLLLGPRFSRLLQLSEQFVVDFPAH
jgi:hypothetical protein